MNSKQQFQHIPAIPDTLEGVVAAVKVAEQAIAFWEPKTRTYTGLSSAAKEKAKYMLSRWKAFKVSAQQAVESYQMRMF